MSTPAIRGLEKQGIDFRAHEYHVAEEVGDGYGEAVAAAIGADPGRVFKTLMAVVDGEHVVAIIPVGERLSMKALATAAGGKKADMAASAEAERRTGYVSGGISPLGQRRRHRTFVDRSAGLATWIYVSAGKRGLQVELRVEDLLDMTDGVLADLV